MFYWQIPDLLAFLTCKTCQVWDPRPKGPVCMLWLASASHCFPQVGPSQFVNIVCTARPNHWCLISFLYLQEFYPAKFVIFRSVFFYGRVFKILVCSVPLRSFSKYPPTVQRVRGPNKAIVENSPWK